MSESAGVVPPAGGSDYTGEDLIAAAGDGDLEMVKAIVEGGVDVNWTDDESGITALMNSTSGGNVELVRYLLEAGADLNLRDSEGYSAFLHVVDQHGQIAGDAEGSSDYWEIMRLLAGAGADVNAKSNEGETALSLATSYADSEEGKTVELLKQLGARE